MSLDETAFDAARKVIHDYIPTGVAGGISITALVRRCLKAYLDSLGEIRPLEIEAGDVVRCIDASDYFFIVSGQTYTVEKVDRVKYLVLKGSNGFAYPPGRFELVERPVEQELADWEKALIQTGPDTSEPVEGRVEYDTVSLSDETIQRLANAISARDIALTHEAGRRYGITSPASDYDEFARSVASHFDS